MSHTDKILVVEDDDTLRLLTTKQLTRLGFPSDSVEDGSHALRKTAEFTYKLILMDVQMPLMDGIEATIAIRQAEKASKRDRVPIVAMTANPDRSLCLNADMDDFIFKPVMLPELEQLLEKWLGKPSLQTEDAGKTGTNGKNEATDIVQSPEPSAISLTATSQAAPITASDEEPNPESNSSGQIIS